MGDARVRKALRARAHGDAVRSVARAREATIQREIELALGAEPDCIVLRNNVGVARTVDDEGRERFTAYGLGVGSPDLILILGPRGRLVGLEVKRPGEDATAEQRRVHGVWRRFGAIVSVVHSVDEARVVLERARGLEVDGERL